MSNVVPNDTGNGPFINSLIYNKEVCSDILYELYVSEGRYNSFLSLALFNLVLGLTFYLKSKLFK